MTLSTAVIIVIIIMGLLEWIKAIIQIIKDKGWFKLLFPALTLIGAIVGGLQFGISAWDRVLNIFLLVALVQLTYKIILKPLAKFMQWLQEKLAKLLVKK